MEDRRRRQYRISSSMELENVELKVEGYENAPQSLREEMRASHASTDERNVQKHTRKKTEFLELQGTVQSKEIAIKQLREEVQSSHRSIEQLHQNYACVRGLNEAKDATIRKLHTEVDLLQEALEEAQREKIQTLDSLHTAQTELAAVNVDKSWLQEQVRMSQQETHSEIRSVGCASISSQEDLVRRMEDVRRERETLQELIGTASAYEETIRNLDSNRSVQSYSSQRESEWRLQKGDYQTHSRERQTEKVDEKVIFELGSKMSEVEERLKKAVLSQKYQLHVEREQLIQEFKGMQKQVLDHQRHLDVHKRDLAAKDTIIQRLKSTKASLESEVDSLKRDVAATQAENDRCLQNHRELQRELSASKSKLSKLEADLENERHQKNFMRGKLDEIDSFSAEKVKYPSFIS